MYVHMLTLYFWRINNTLSLNYVALVSPLLPLVTRIDAHSCLSKSRHLAAESCNNILIDDETKCKSNAHTPQQQYYSLLFACKNNKDATKAAKVDHVCAHTLVTLHILAGVK